MKDIGENTGSKVHWNIYIFILLAFTAVAVFLLWAENRGHLMEAFPFILLLLCPLIHLFMHRGHQRGHGDYRNRDSDLEEGNDDGRGME